MKKGGTAHCPSKNKTEDEREREGGREGEREREGGSEGYRERGRERERGGGGERYAGPRERDRRCGWWRRVGKGIKRYFKRA